MSTVRDREVTFRRERMTGRSFDELAKGLAGDTISRGRVLRLIGSTIVSAALSSDTKSRLLTSRPSPNSPQTSRLASGRTNMLSRSILYS